jgi:hypothetical protein
MPTTLPERAAQIQSDFQKIPTTVIQQNRSLLFSQCLQDADRPSFPELSDFLSLRPKLAHDFDD